MSRSYPREFFPETLHIASLTDFSLEELCYEYPAEIVPQGQTPTSWLRHLTEEGMQKRWPAGTPATVQALVEHKFELISDLKYDPFFLTVYDVVAFARS